MEKGGVSVAKGVFVVKHGSSTKLKKGKGRTDIFVDKLWYNAYRKLWQITETKLEQVHKKMFSTLLQNIVTFVKNVHIEPIEEIATAVLLTGINMPDHSKQFSGLVTAIKSSVTPHVVTLQTEECQSLKYIIESVAHQFVYGYSLKKEDFDNTQEESKRRKGQCNFMMLQSWYESTYRDEGTKATRNRNEEKSLVVIIPDFEGVNEKIMQNFVQIISSYGKVLPIVLIFGVATSLTALHRNLPYHISSKISVQVFNSQPSTTYLNEVLDNVFFAQDFPFRLGGKVFNLLMDIFLFYDPSVKGFINNFKFALMDHFSNGNIMALCRCYNVRKVLAKFTSTDYTNLNNLPSFKAFMTNQDKEFRDKLKDVESLNNFIVETIDEFQNSLRLLHFYMRQLHVLVHDLPKTPLGKHIRELYTITVTKNLTTTPEFIECFKLLEFQAKNELIFKLEKLIELAEESEQFSKLNKTFLKDYINCLNNHLEDLDSPDSLLDNVEIEQEPEEVFMETKVTRRSDLKKKLFNLTQKPKALNLYELAKLRLISFLKQTFEENVKNLKSSPFYDLFFFNDLSIRRFLIGSHRAAIHNSLSDPQFYLKCDCCASANETAIVSTMPDISVAYKLHLEYGKYINLFDWLQSYLCVVDSKWRDEENEKMKVPPELHARFTQAVADLEFLGFIKTSKRKTDYVQRLTWGG